MSFDDDLREPPDDEADIMTTMKTTAPVVVRPWSWLPPRLWTCPRCSTCILTREAGPRCPRGARFGRGRDR